MIALGVIADTHVPDRARRLNPRAVSVFREAGVRAILHAGDICSARVLHQLEEVAPVHAVRGNRDFVRLSYLPQKLTLEFEGITIGMTHGHGGVSGYLVNKLCYLIEGYQIVRYQNWLPREFPTAKVIIFGHTHRSENSWSNGVLFFNPGSASKLRWGHIPSSVGLLHIWAGGRIEGEIISIG
ncbi:MAG: metallophosphatase family protein [Chloroflexi bacterium]|nr:metallophosphatase family protein [Chloroflexota bacterium]MBU1660760.1 metallophosphatase family protein [Chloroflexota bacterium]